MSDAIRFAIAIGDWSGDGHGHSDQFWFTSNKPIEAVREAYFTAKKNKPELCPERYCDKYEEDGHLTEAEEASLRAAGAPMPEQMDWDWGPEAMARIVAWFICLGDTELRLEPAEETPPTLHFYGKDASGRHIGFIGYGMFL